MKCDTMTAGLLADLNTVDNLQVRRPFSPLSIIFFASGGPGNLYAALEAQRRRPDLLSVDLLISDRLYTPSSFLASASGIPVIELDYKEFLVSGSEEKRSEEFHDYLADRIMDFETSRGFEFDLAVLAYRRIISGRLFERFRDRAINQHPADLTVFDENGDRRYVGIGGLSRAIKDGVSHTRTSTILVSSKVDGGEILCQGPRMAVSKIGSYDPQVLAPIEQAQKAFSDWPSLIFALENLALNRFSFSSGEKHSDGSRLIAFDGIDTPYGGVSLP